MARPKKQATAKRQAAIVVDQPPAKRQTATVYEAGETPTHCRECASGESLVLKTTVNEKARMKWRRRRCTGCGVVWMSKTPIREKG